MGGEPYLLVVENGNVSGTTIGRANGAFSVVRHYFMDMSINRTSMEWGDNQLRQVGSLFETW